MEGLELSLLQPPLINRQVMQIGTIEIVLLAIAISLDVFAAMVIQGSMLSRINYLNLLKVGILFGSWQTVTVGLSNVITGRLIDYGIPIDQRAVQDILLIFAIGIFTILGLFMIWKYRHKDTILERRADQLRMTKILSLAVITSIDAILVGMGLGALDVSIFEILLPFIIFSILAVFLGIYVGHWFGFEEKPVAHYVAGTIFLVISVDLLFRLVSI